MNDDVIFKIRNLTCRYIDNNPDELLNINKLNLDQEYVEKLLGKKIAKLDFNNRQKLLNVLNEKQSLSSDDREKDPIIRNWKQVDSLVKRLSPQLKISKLDIYRNKLTMIVGRSGCGKSTLLETLGLMNKTFDDNSQITFYPFGLKGKNFDYQQLWKKENRKKIADVRRKYLSFIFQRTNLMPNFKNKENACISNLLHGDSLKNSEYDAKLFGDSVKMEKNWLDKYPNQLSGGQQQRIAFIRAILPKYSVLFGDEPTGNLDEKTSEDVMNNVREKGVSSVIVTHNIDLALKYSDQIIFLEPNGINIEPKIFNSVQNGGGRVWKNWSRSNLKKELNNLMNR